MWFRGKWDFGCATICSRACVTSFLAVLSEADAIKLVLKDATERPQIIREPWPFNKSRETAYSLWPSLFISRGLPQDNQYIKAKIFISQINLPFTPNQKKNNNPHSPADCNICRVKPLVVLNPPQTPAILLACSLNFSLQIFRASK